MGQAEELLQNIAGTTTHVEADFVTIGSDRYMVVPDNLKKLGVSPDHGVNTIHFVGPRYSENGSDLSKMSIWVNFMRSDDYPDSCRCTNVKVDTSDETKLHYDWEISRNVTEIHGNLTVLVCAKEVDAAGNEKDHWNSELNRDFYVSEGLEVQENVISQYPDLVEYMLLRVATVENKTTKAAMLSYVDQYLDEDPSVIIEHIESIIAQQPIQEFVNEYLDDYVDIGTTDERTLVGSVAGAYEMDSMAGVSEQAPLEGKNLFNVFGNINTEKSNYGTATTYLNTVSDDGTITIAANNERIGSRGQLLKGVLGKTLTISFDILSFGTGNGVNCYIIENNEIVVTKTFNASGGVNFTHDCTTDEVLVAFQTSYGQNSQIKNVQVEVGTKATPYEPYCGNKPAPNPDYPQEIKSVGPEVTVKTMQGVELTQGYWNTIGQLISGSGHVSNKTPIPCKAGDVVKITIDEEVDSFSSRCFKADGTNITHNVTRSGNTYTFTVPNDATKFCFVFIKADLTPENIGPVGVSVNGVGESSAKITLPEELRGIGDVRDVIEKRAGRWGVERKRTKRVFDGVSESWGEGNSSSGKHYIYLGDASISIDETALLSHATYDLNGTLETGNFTRSGGLSFQVWTEMTLAEWKAFLAEEYAAGTPVTLEVKLATPTWEELPDEYQKVLDNLRVYDGTTHVFVEGTEVQPVVTSKYGTSEVGARAIDNTNAIEKTHDRIDLFEIQTGDQYDIYGTKAGGLRLTEMTGKTEQKTLSGKNKLGYTKPANTTKNGITITYNDDGSITLNGTCTDWFFVNLNYVADSRALPNGKYKLINTGLSGAYFSVFVDGVNASGTIYNASFELTVNNTKDYIRFDVLNGTVLNNVTIYPMVVLDTETDLSYEPYCGGIPSPNPAYPQALENVGDCVEMINGALKPSTGLIEASPVYMHNKHMLPCKTNDIVKIVCEKLFRYVSIVWYDKNKNYISYKSVDNVKENSFVAPSGSAYFNFDVNFDKNAELTLETLPKITLTVNGKHVVQIVEHGKNFIDLHRFNPRDNEKKTIDGDKITVTGIWYHEIKLELKPNTNYFISCTAESATVNDRFAVFKTEGLKTISLDNGRFNTGDNSKVSLMIYSGNGTSGTSVYKNIQLEEGSEATPYEPYTEKVATIFLDEPLREGDRLVKVDGVWYVKRKRAKGVLDENTVFKKNSVSNNANYLYYTDAFANKMKRVSKIVSDKLINIYTDDASMGVINGGNEKTNIGISSGINNSCIYINVGYYLSENTNEAANEYISNNPIEFEYELATPVLTPLDLESQKALNNLETFKDVTYIEVDSKLKPGIKYEYGASGAVAYTLKALLNTETLLAMQSASEAAAIPAVVNEPEVTAE